MSNGTQLYLDNATRANENPLSNGGAWSAVTGYSALQIVSNLIEGTVISTNCAMRVGTWAALGGSDDQYVEIVLGHNITTTDAVHMWCRANSDRSNAYLFKLAATGSCAIIKVVANVATTLVTFASFSPAATTRIRFTVIGSQLTVYQNQQFIGTVQDSDITTGLPGLYCFAGTLTNATVSEFRAGNPAGNVNGPWTKQGSIIHATTADLNSHLIFSGVSNQTAMYDNNVQLITPNPDGKVFKIWFMAGNAISYAESQTGLTGGVWTRQAVASLAGFGLPRVFRNGSTYYAFVSHQPTVWTHVDLYTCQNGDNNWVLAQTDILVSGGAGSWDESQAAYLSVVGQIGGTWYALYNGLSAAGVYGMGLITASVITGPWTKFGSNPVVTRVGTPEHMVQIGSTWYGWLANSTTGCSNIVRMSTTDFITWSTKTVSLQPENQFEGINTTPSVHGSIAVPSVVEASGHTYMFYSSTTSDATSAQGYILNVATAPYSMAQIILGGDEYFANQPAAFTDIFNRADANPLGAPYTVETGSNAHQIVSNLVEPIVLNQQSRSFYTNVPALSTAQFTEITIAQLLTGAFANPLARMATGAITNFAATVGGPTGSNFNININRVVAGSGTQLSVNLSALVSVGDVFRVRSIDITNNGVLVSLYQNNNLILEVTDFTTPAISIGNPGFGSFAATGNALTDSKISKFRAGNADAVYVPGNVPSTNAPVQLTITMLDGTQLTVTIPAYWTASQYVQNLRRAGGVWSDVPDPRTPATWYPYRDWKSLLTS